MEVETSMESVVFVEAGGSRWDLKSCGKTPKPFYQAFFVGRDKFLSVRLINLVRSGVRGF